MIRRPPRSTPLYSSAASDVYKRQKLVPAQAIADMQEDGAGFAGFATWLDFTPAHPDMLAVPDQVVQSSFHGNQK